MVQASFSFCGKEKENIKADQKKLKVWKMKRNSGIERERGRSKLAQIFEPFVIVTRDATNINKVEFISYFLVGMLPSNCFANLNLKEVS